jgi:hypothetical protein
VLHVALNLGFIETPADETFDIEYGVGSIPGSLVLGSLTDKALIIVESNT